METQTIEIPWNDGSQEKLVLRVQETSNNSIEISLDSNPNITGNPRKKIITFKDTTRYKPLDFILEINQVAEGIGVMEIGSTFIIR